MTRPGVQAAQRSCIGARTRNEDCVGIERLHEHWCLVLSDGAGGHGEGGTASQLVVERVRSGFRGRPPADPADLRELLLDAHDEVVKGQRALAAAGTPSTMCATVVTLVLDLAARSALWGHVGDSRLYRWQSGRLVTVTRDDSAAQAVLDTGLVGAEQARELPHRSVLLAALGGAEEAAPHVSGPVELQDADVFLLCSDGWWSGLEARFLDESLAQARTPDRWLELMEQATLARADARQDNFSAIACWL